MLTEQVLKHNHHIIYNSKQLFEYATRMQQNNKTIKQLSKTKITVCLG